MYGPLETLHASAVRAKAAEQAPLADSLQPSGDETLMHLLQSLGLETNSNGPSPGRGIDLLSSSTSPPTLSPQGSLSGILTPPDSEGCASAADLACYSSSTDSLPELSALAPAFPQPDASTQDLPAVLQSLLNMARTQKHNEQHASLAAVLQNAATRDAVALIHTQGGAQQAQHATAASTPSSNLLGELLTPPNTGCNLAAPTSLPPPKFASMPAGTDPFAAVLPHAPAYFQTATSLNLSPPETPSTADAPASALPPAAAAAAAAAYGWPVKGPAGLAPRPGSAAPVNAAQLAGLSAYGAASLPAFQAGNLWAPAAPAPSPLLHPAQQQAQLPAAAPGFLPGTALPLPPGLVQQLAPHLQALLLSEQRAGQAQQPMGMPMGQHYNQQTHSRPFQTTAAFLARKLAQAAEHQDPPETLMGIDGRYQPYCQQVITSPLNEAAVRALATVKMLQAAEAAGSAPATGPKRFFCSLKEVSKVVSAARCLIVAPDVRVSSTAHINPVRALQRILRDAESLGVPVIFALSRRGIGQIFGRDKSMSIVALMSLESLEGDFQVMVDEAIKGRKLFMEHRIGCNIATRAPVAAATAAATGAAPHGTGTPLQGGSFGAAATAIMAQLQAGMASPGQQFASHYF